ncbi:hypothetical protein B0T21DRAFT_351552 [Apiosordaria backusii]|uniref:Uncharacterized protein n=1 Tax=Apiosordaria backusii TaxID=314023 RepID=A0AA40AMU0_9PEZI|nr:hypothetical protein B0T21DRAFT_351552 [Apiosordaria backusii]
MRLFFLASLVSAVTAMTCSIVGGGAGQCRSCPARGCEIIENIPNGETRDFTCIWRQDPGIIFLAAAASFSNPAQIVLYVEWTAFFTIRFNEHPIITHPAPLKAEKKLKRSQKAQMLVERLTTLESLPDASIDGQSHAIKCIISTFFPDALSHPKTNATLDFYLGQEIFHLRTPSLWRSHRSANTTLAYISMSQLTPIRAAKNVNHHNYVVATLLAMAKARVCHKVSASSPSQLRSASR